MNRFLAGLQVGLALLLFVIAIATTINMVLIAMRPETISVVNTLIGQTVMIVCLVALGRILWKKGIAQFKAQADADTATSEDANGA